MATSLARRTFMGVAATAATAGLVIGASGAASAHTTTTSFNAACVAQPSVGGAQHQIQGYSVQVTDSSPGKYRIQFDPQTTPGFGFGYTLVNISNIKAAFSATGITGATVVAGTGYGYSGTPATTVVSSSRVELAGGLTVPASTTFQLPMIEITASGPVKLDTAGTAGQYNNAANFLTFTSNAKLGLIPISAPTRCIPADGPLGDSDMGTSPTLNAGAGVLHA